MKNHVKNGVNNKKKRSRTLVYFLLCDKPYMYACLQKGSVSVRGSDFSYLYAGKLIFNLHKLLLLGLLCGIPAFSGHLFIDSILHAEAVI